MIHLMPNDSFLYIIGPTFLGHQTRSSSGTQPWKFLFFLTSFSEIIEVNWSQFKSLSGVLRRNWQISVLCQFSIFLSISVLFMPFHVPKSVQHNKFNRLKLLHHKFCEIQILGWELTERWNGKKWICKLAQKDINS